MLDDLALTLSQKAQSLGAMLHPITCQEIANLLTYTNTYYSNLIEGHNTKLLDIERAMHEDFSQDSAKRALQLEAKAHVEVAQEIDALLSGTPDLNIFSEDFITQIHRAFYQRLPVDFYTILHPRTQEQIIIEPGMLRARDVQVGGHIAPSYKALPSFLEYFQQRYHFKQLHGIQKIMAIAASHHRLAWIHPFLDGNGRVMRLLTVAMFKQLKLDAHGLWSMSRGLARNRDAYYAALAMADLPRQGDLDVRGNLSEKGLEFFCEFFLRTAIDQLDFMQELLNLESLSARMMYYIELRQRGGIPNVKPIRLEAQYLLRDVLLRGEVPRFDVSRITGLKERTARALVSELLKENLLQSASSRAGLRIKIPVAVGEYYFPKLY
ncbi:MAG: Fic family protein [Gammaproteobacteria bacterium]